MAHKPTSDSAAEAAATVDTFAEAGTASVEIEGTDINTVDIAPEVASAQAEVAAIEAAIAVIGTGSAAAASALTASLEVARGKLALAEAEAARQTERLAEVAAANAAAEAAKLPDSVRDAMLAAIEARYAPVPEVAPQPEVAPEVGVRRAPSDRTLAANAAAAANPLAEARAAAAVDAFDADSGKLACSVNRRPNTRFSGMVALAPSSAGVANAADYDGLTRAIRAYLINVKRWQVSDSDGQSVPEAKWLASRGRYVLGSGVKSALTCFHSGAEIAQYADGRFRFAYPGTPNVRFLRTDNAAWQAFIGTAAAAQPAAAAPASTEASAPQAAAQRTPSAPQAMALPNGSIATTARCQHCQARNIVGTPECNACGSADWLLA